MRTSFRLTIILLTIFLRIETASACWAAGSGLWAYNCRTLGGGTIAAIMVSPFSVVLQCHDDSNFPPGSVYGTPILALKCALENAPLQTPEATSRPTCEQGSIVDIGQQSLAEEIPLLGTNFFLRYDSNRSFGFAAKRTVERPLTGASAPTNLNSADITVNIAGQTTTSTYSAFSPNMTHVSTWNGQDGSGQSISGSSVVNFSSNENYTSPPKSGIYDDYQVGGSASGAGLPPTFVGGRIAKSVGLAGWTLSAVHFYDSVRHIIELGDGGVFPVDATVTPSGFMARITGSNEVLIFNNLGLHIQTLNVLTGSVKLSVTYYPDGRLDTVTDAYSRTHVVSYDTNLHPIKITGPYGHQTTLTVDANGFLASVTYPDLSKYQMTYVGTDGLLSTFKKPLGQVSSFTYDSLGRLSQDTGVDGFFINLSRSIASTSETRISALSSEGEATRHDILFNFDPTIHTTNKYRSYADQTAVTDNLTYRLISQPSRSNSFEYFGADARFPGSQSIVSTQYFRDGGGSVSTSTNEAVSYVSGTGPFNVATLQTTHVVSGQTYQEIYSGSTNSVQTITPLGRTIRVSLDLHERPTSYQFADLNPTTFTYDANGKLSRFDQGARHGIYTYNTLGLLATSKNSLGQTTKYAYDSKDRLIKATLPGARVIKYVWDANDNLKSITPPTRPLHGFSFTNSDLLKNYDPPTLSGTGTTLFEYDLDRRLKKITRPNLDQMTFSYFAHNLSGITTSLGNYTFTYSGSTNALTNVSSPYGVATARTYQGDFLLSETTSGAALGKIGYGYDVNLRPLKIDILNSAGNVLSPLTYSYNNDSEVISTQALTLTRDPARSFVTGLGLDGTNEVRTYNLFGELKTLKAMFGTAVHYKSVLTRDKLGRVTKNVETLGGVATTFNYTYNASGQLTTVLKNAAAYSSYVYDLNGNRTSRTFNGVTEQATTDAQDRLLTHGSLSFAYSANGDLVSKTDSISTTNYTYDSIGNLKRVDLPIGQLIEYVLDGFNRRVAKKVNGVVERYFVYQNQLQIAAELDSSGNLISRYVYGSRANVPDYMIKSGINYRIVSDQLGSVRLVVRSSDGVIMQRMDYDEFGRLLSDTSPGFQPFGFAGGLYDPDTKLVHFGARTYDAETGRWLSKDPILFAGGDTNLYGYVLQDPVNLVDPSGRCPMCIGAGIGAVIGGVSGYLTTHTAQGALIGAVSGALSGTTLGSGIVAGALLGGTTSAALQISSGTSFSNLNYGRIFGSTLAGGLGAAAGIGAARFFQLPYNAIGRPQGEFFGPLSESILSSSVGGITGAGADSFFGGNTCPRN